MKRITVLLLACTLLLACVPTPTEEVVLNKTEGRLEAAIAETTPVPAYETEQVEKQPKSDEPQGTLRSALSAPEHCTDSAEGKVYGGELRITIDADVEVPNVSAVPVYTVRTKPFSPEEKKRIAKLLLGDGPYYERNRERTKKDRLKTSIDRLSLVLSEIDDRAYGEDYPYDEMRAANEAELQKSLERYMEMPEPGPMEPWTGSFQDAEICLANGENDWVKIQNGQIDFYDSLQSDWGAILFRIPHGEDDARAIQTAGASFEALAEDRFLPYGILSNTEMLGPERKNDAEQYLVGLARTYAGIPCYAYTSDHGSDTAMQAAGVPAYSEQMFPESISVNVRDGKVIALTWNAAMEVIKTENENVALLPFSEIVGLFKKTGFSNRFSGSGTRRGTECADRNADHANLFLLYARQETGRRRGRLSAARMGLHVRGGYARE